MFEANRLELYSLKETLKMRETDWEKERSRLFDEVKALQGELDSMSSKLGRLHGEADSRVLNY
jgi:predicted  nucleic acid-binding Zn-ribbon protein